ncbi:MAG TPA: MBL fold metallo-hydrolase [archaeon]|nr:MBL fold metallo-hydrolase [archaeon]
MKLRCLGGFREVGRNAVLLETGRQHILMDCGIKVEDGETPLMPKKVDSVLLGHAHLDHTGTLPMLYKQGKPTIYATAATFDTTHLLLKDSMKVAKIKGRPELFTLNDITKMMEHESRVTYGQKISIKDAKVEVYDAGHVPGSCMFLIEVNGKRIVYTSDFNTLTTRLLNGAKANLKDIDVLIMESTYSSRNHSKRLDVEKALYKTVIETIENNGVALIPAFAVGRSAEILSVLHSFKPKFPIYLDGMARDATEIILKYPELLRKASDVEKAVDYTIPVYTEDERRGILNEPCAIVTTGGCLDGGPVTYYIKRLWDKINCSLLATGYQIPGSAGRYLFDTGHYVTEDGIDLKIKMKKELFDFSAHCGRDQLFDFVNKVRPKKVIAIHGDHCERFATEVRSRFGIDAIAPKMGDVLEIK